MKRTALALALVLVSAGVAYAWSTNGTGTARSRAGLWAASCSAPGTQTFAANADTWTGSPNPGPQGTFTLLELGRNGTSGFRRVWARWPGVPNVPSNCTVTDASVTFQCATNSSLALDLTIFPVTSAWAESVVHPGPSIGAPSVAFTGQTCSGTTTRTYTITTMLQNPAAYAAVQSNGINIRRTTEVGTGTVQTFQYRSREFAGGIDPSLSITFG